MVALAPCFMFYPGTTRLCQAMRRSIGKGEDGLVALLVNSLRGNRAWFTKESLGRRRCFQSKPNCFFETSGFGVCINAYLWLTSLSPAAHDFSEPLSTPPFAEPGGFGDCQGAPLLPPHAAAHPQRAAPGRLAVGGPAGADNVHGVLQRRFECFGRGVPSPGVSSHRREWTDNRGSSSVWVGGVSGGNTGPPTGEDGATVRVRPGLTYVWMSEDTTSLLRETPVYIPAGFPRNERGNNGWGGLWKAHCMTNVLRVSPRGEMKDLPNMAWYSFRKGRVKIVLDCFRGVVGLQHQRHSRLGGGVRMSSCDAVLPLHAALLANCLTLPDCNRTYS